MKLGWRVLLPISLAWIVAVAGMRLAFNEGITRQQILTWGGGAVAVLLIITLFWPERKREQQDTSREPSAPGGTSFPVPPMPGQEPDAHVQSEGAHASASPGSDHPSKEGTRA
jgi:NADH-quinone oxidoreductase subunit H